MIYFVQSVDGGDIKIGTTGILSKRLLQLEMQRGTRLKVLAVMKGSFPVERKLHGQFEHLNTEGEWFRPAPELFEFIEHNAAPWNGRDEFVPVNVDSEAIFDAKIAAASKRVSLSVYLSDVVREAATRDIDDFMARERAR